MTLPVDFVHFNFHGLLEEECLQSRDSCFTLGAYVSSPVTIESKVLSFLFVQLRRNSREGFVSCHWCHMRTFGKIILHTLYDIETFPLNSCVNTAPQTSSIEIWRLSKGRMFCPTSTTAL
ncbi:hypothetical protein NPIL_434571 [Nephila pilipes]|uniref:Uncharacterized protein n=1 Tax=Nephila pilipes TaxID=299642 RepID=A0A8X6NA67_NEPPI|nr:hypothetical protein NPIL_434571 [Nephila pilipes]